MDEQLSIRDELHELIQDFVSEPAYGKVHLLSHQSQSICFQMQSDLVNAHHILGDIDMSNDEGVKGLSMSIAVRNLETFVEAASAARDLYLILPDHLIEYQDRAQNVIKRLKQQAA